MYNHQLNTFLQVSDAGSFSKAGEVLYISPTAVMKQINLLESTMDVQLFNRTPRGLTLTNAREILKNLGQNIDIIAGIVDERLLHLRGCAALELTREPVCCAVSIYHPLAQKQRLCIEDLYGENLILIRRNCSKYIDLLRDDLWEHHPQIHIVDFDFFSAQVFNQCEHSDALLMAYSLLSEATHEWLGAAMMILFLLHHILNAGWIKKLCKGRYHAYRIVQTALVFLVLLAMLGTIISGIVLSRYLFTFLPIDSGQDTARLAHLLCSYWSFLLISLHLGLHWNMIAGILRRMTAVKLPARCAIVFCIITTFVVIYGVIGFFRQDILSYLLLWTHFVFIDFDRSLLLFFADYLAMMGLFVFFGFCGSQVAVRLSARQTEPNDKSQKRRQIHE